MEITSIGLLLAKTESSYNFNDVPPIPATHAIPTVGDSLSWEISSTAVDRKLMDGTLDMVPGYNALPYVTLKFSVELRNHGFLGYPPEIGALLRAANLTQTLVDSTSASYTPGIVTDFGPSLFCWWYAQNKLHQLTGGKVTWMITCETGKIPVIDFTIVGFYATPTDQSIPGGAVFSAVKPPLCEGMSIQLPDLAITPPFSKLTLDLGNRIEMRVNGNATDGVGGFLITGSDPKATLDPESSTESGAGWFAKWRAQAAPHVTAVIGPPGNQIALDLAAAEIKNVAYAARNNQRIVNIDFGLRRADLPSATPPFILAFL